MHEIEIGLKINGLLNCLKIECPLKLPFSLNRRPMSRPLKSISKWFILKDVLVPKRILLSTLLCIIDSTETLKMSLPSGIVQLVNFPVKRPNKKPAKNSNNTSIARNRNSNGNKSWSRREQPVQTCPAAIPHRDKRTFFFKKNREKKCCNRPSNSSSSPGLIFQADPSSSSFYFSFLFIYFILFKFSGGKWRLICIINGISAATTISLLFF